MDNLINYDKEMQKIVANIDLNNKPKLLLHACCAPCSSYCIESLQQYFDITVFFYNPNIFPCEEYCKRLEEIKTFLCKWNNNIGLIAPKYNDNEFYGKIKGLEDCLEGGQRCWICYALRLEKTAEKAHELGYDYFASTLSISPHKNSKKLNEIGYALQSKLGVNYLPNDFKKRGGFKRSIELSNMYNFYRQDYCGCEFSQRQSKEKK